MRSRRARRMWQAPGVAMLGAALLACLPAPLWAQTFDRFFTTASERRVLDQARADFQAPAPVVQQTPQPQAEPEPPRGPVVPAITVSGVVIRGDGKNTSWINGSRIRPDEVTAEGIRVQPSGGRDPQVQIRLPNSTQPLRLRPGQRIDLNTGSVLDAYQREVREDQGNVFDTLAPVAGTAERNAPAGSAGSKPAQGGG